MVEPSEIDVTETELTISSAGRRALAGSLIARPGDRLGRPGIVFVHGFGSDQLGYRPRAEAAARQLDAICLTFDLGGHGRSVGERNGLSPADHLDDLRAATDALLERAAVGDGRLGLCGASYGAYLSALLVAERPIRRLLLRAPALYPDELLHAPANQREDLKQAVQPSEALRRIERFAGATLVVKSEHDETIPGDVVDAYVAAARDVRHETILGAAHALSNPAWNERFVELILEFFARL
jgi:uncharacterized protein